VDQEKTRKPAIKQTELQRLQNEIVGGTTADKAKKAPSAAKARMMKGARNACGPLNGRDWRWGSN
jgi:hypothetical protein|tara:strand:+ start:32904 stop:33098 length:195 start_codon:yes stop_codon:yes gene_type:complete